PEHLRERRLLLQRVAGGRRAVLAHPGEVGGGGQRHAFGLAEARAPEELLQVAVALDHLVAHAVEAPLEAALETRQVGLEPGPGGGRALALPVLEERIEGAAPLLELGERRALAALLGTRRRRGRQRRGQRHDRARRHSE